MEHDGPGLALHGAELLQEGASGAVEDEDAVGALAGDVQVVVESEGEAPGPIETATARLHKHIEERTSVGIYRSTLLVLKSDTSMVGKKVKVKPLVIALSLASRATKSLDPVDIFGERQLAWEPLM